MAMKKFSVTKKTPETTKRPSEPTRPTTPAPAARLETASVLLFRTSKNPEDGSSRCGSDIRCGSFVGGVGFGRRLPGAVDVDRVIGDGVAHHLDRHQAGDDEEADGARQASGPQRAS